MTRSRGLRREGRNRLEDRVEERTADLERANEQLVATNERLRTESEQREQAEEALKERLQFETLLVELSARFIKLPADQIDGEIEDAERRICELLSFDRSALWQVPEGEPGALLLTHIHPTPRGQQVPERPDARNFFPWSVQKVLNGETLTISKLVDLPPEAARDREAYRLYGTTSTVVIPLSVRRRKSTWRPDLGDVARGKRLAGGGRAGARAGRSGVRQCPRPETCGRGAARSEARLSLAAASADARLWELEMSTGRIWTTDKGRGFYAVAPGEELTFERLLGFVHPDDRERFGQTGQQALHSGQDLSVEYRILRPDGSVRWIASRGLRMPARSGSRTA